MYFKRRIDSQLQSWKDSYNRKPLLVRGARQIGKSSSIRNFAESFKYFVEVNFEENKSAIAIFKQEQDVATICQRLSMLYSTPIIPGETLLFFDEIQACPEAIKALWFFKEKLPALHVVAAGSLLEFALKNMQSYGVGRVSSMFMYPMSFAEFLVAAGKEIWLKALNDASPQEPLFPEIHRELVGLYRTFLMVGGMPASVGAWIETGNFRNCEAELADIQQTYYDDFSKYGEKINPELLRNTLQSVIAQTGGKFTYSKVNGGFTPDEIRRALGMLADAGLIKAVRHTAANGLPLGAEVNTKFTKYIYLDSGLLMRVLDMDFGGSTEVTEMILAGSEDELVNKGYLAELSVGWELVKAADFRTRYDLFYWENLANGATSEIDYVLPHNMKILPVEVKAGTSGKMKSLRLFLQKKKMNEAVRTSLENFGTITYEDSEGEKRTITIIPIFAIGRLTARQPELL